MFQLDLRSRIPIYEQIIEKIKELIISGILKPHQKLPSVRQLAQQISINPNTIQKAYRDLEQQGYVYSIVGKGNFVNQIKANESDIRLQALLKDLEKYIAEVLFLGMTKAELIKLIDEIERKGGMNHDRN